MVDDVEDIEQRRAYAKKTIRDWEATGFKRMYGDHFEANKDVYGEIMCQDPTSLNCTYFQLGFFSYMDTLPTAFSLTFAAQTAERENYRTFDTAAYLADNTTPEAIDYSKIDPTGPTITFFLAGEGGKTDGVCAGIDMWEAMPTYKRSYEYKCQNHEMFMGTQQAVKQ